MLFSAIFSVLDPRAISLNWQKRAGSSWSRFWYAVGLVVRTGYAIAYVCAVGAGIGLVLGASGLLQKHPEHSLFIANTIGLSIGIPTLLIMLLCMRQARDAWVFAFAVPAILVSLVLLLGDSAVPVADNPIWFFVLSFVAHIWFLWPFYVFAGDAFDEDRFSLLAAAYKTGEHQSGLDLKPTEVDIYSADASKNLGLGPYS